MSLKEVLKQLGIKLIGWVKSNCVNNLLSDRADLPLAAAQGKVLDGKITALNSNITTWKLINGYKGNIDNLYGTHIAIVATSATGTLPTSYTGNQFILISFQEENFYGAQIAVGFASSNICVRNMSYSASGKGVWNEWRHI